MIQAARQYPRVLAAREAFLLCPCCLMIHHGGVESKSWLKSGLTRMLGSLDVAIGLKSW